MQIFDIMTRPFLSSHPPELFLRNSISNECQRLQKVFYSCRVIFQRIIQHCEEENGRVWTTELEEKLFTPVRVKYAGDHNSFTRRALFVAQSETCFSPAHIVKPGTTVHFGRMSSAAFIRMLGERK